MDEQTVHLVVHRPGVGQGGQQAIGELRLEMSGVENKIRVRLEELGGQRFTVAGAAVAEITRDLLDDEQLDPFLALCRVGGNLRIERLRHPVEGHAPVRLEHELLLEPEPLLEVFELREEGDDLVRHSTDGAHPRERAPQSGRVPHGQVGQVQHFTLEIEVQLAAEEAGQILVDGARAGHRLRP